MLTVTLSFLVGLASLGIVDTKVVGGQLWTGENWKFVTRFCFLSSYGKFEYDVQYDVSYGVQNIDLYYDTEEQWYRAYGHQSDLTSCREKESVLQVCSITSILFECTVRTCVELTRTYFRLKTINSSI